MSEEATNDEPQATSHEDEISLLDLLIVLAKHKKLVLGLPFVAGLVSIAISFQLPYIYTATTKLLPPQRNPSAAVAMLAQPNQLGSLGNLAGSILGVKNPNDLYIGILKSRTVADNLIERFDLNTYYGQKWQSWTRRTLESGTVIASGKDGIITIEVEDKDPKFAAALANAYVDELTKLTNVLAVTEASRGRLFLERQLAQTKENLAAAEIAAKRGIEKGGIAQVEAQGRSLVEVTARLRAQISAKEVQISTMRAFAADRNPELQMAQQELNALKRELSRIEGSSTSATTMVQPREADNSGLDSLARLRDMKYYEILYELLAKQYEIARLDEARDATIIQVMDVAIEPDFRTKPRRTLFVLIWTLAAGFIAIVWVFIQETRARIMTDPAQSERLQTLRRSLFGK